MKAAIVEEFESDRATILLATESAAEGVNLQFCSVVVNYDLPWNPQRIEQRIGRCHRYGQKSRRGRGQLPQHLEPGRRPGLRAAREEAAVVRGGVRRQRRRARRDRRRRASTSSAPSPRSTSAAGRPTRSTPRSTPCRPSSTRSSRPVGVRLARPCSITSTRRSTRPSRCTAIKPSGRSIISNSSCSTWSASRGAAARRLPLTRPVSRWTIRACPAATTSTGAMRRRATRSSSGSTIRWPSS
jgi:superfamily II DNA/RNA helicase